MLQPANSRLHILDQFNRGLFDYLVATDDAVSSTVGVGEPTATEGEAEAEPGAADADGQRSGAQSPSATDAASESAPLDAAPKAPPPSRKRRRAEETAAAAHTAALASAGAGSEKPKKRTDRLAAKLGRDAEYGVARGVDFRGVTTVVNVDFPDSQTA
jgi:ATP-dependent RNA helicase DDX56/DBP9